MTTEMKLAQQIKHLVAIKIRATDCRKYRDISRCSLCVQWQNCKSFNYETENLRKQALSRQLANEIGDLEASKIEGRIWDFYNPLSREYKPLR